ncbi:MAG: phosphate acyltransferase, partial [Clostridia bacterium]|nr:phosphate acyltransferase [Clostridia bacterium]
MLAADAMGGDNAPGCVIDGVKEFLADVPDADIRLFGPKAELENLLGADTLKSGRVQVVDAPDVITMHDEPMMAVRRKT